LNDSAAKIVRATKAKGDWGLERCIQAGQPAVSGESLPVQATEWCVNSIIRWEITENERNRIAFFAMR
jgi:hypothetical protein